MLVILLITFENPPTVVQRKPVLPSSINSDKEAMSDAITETHQSNDSITINPKDSFQTLGKNDAIVFAK